jgi:hypothetical protein
VVRGCHRYSSREGCEWLDRTRLHLSRLATAPVGIRLVRVVSP